MQRTSNYQLPQWEKEDRILMEDFNDMTEKIDAGINGAKNDAATAQAAADAAQQTAVTHKNYVSGTYAGKSDAVTVELGFRPSAVIISRQFDTPAKNDYHHTVLFLDGKTNINFEFLDNGFRAKMVTSYSYYPDINSAGCYYHYLALR